jgi:hypothetical protein
MLRWGPTPLPSIVLTRAPIAAESQKVLQTAISMSVSYETNMIILEEHLAYDFKDFYIRTMAAQINAAFKNMQDNLQVQTIKDALKVDTIIKDFDVLAPPEGSKTPGLLKNIAIGKVILSI